mmetsp:Transcript_19499/g.58948  ORF Transcript_19499/g.58948 Transcript_19499/m.58948 type:complete len:331 (-) Transcript_19499:306-1298(-)|eukprot:CAMPEP_0206141356 /NCGR_PEP_ID=MMETSP1473-20131121/12654_1 /ASSEMBLY_ACC=CAM_ASM_001109 /TAXON_ID=1461547 /ORGANISM="Stichococcus sp, Strain RCC1054" /LENGTH=330 /DNA_ID=CAMNT_0053535887 /DNA_START=204 /DNA_END=1196 /DNA_ORIENTATION=+
MGAGWRAVWADDGSSTKEHAPVAPPQHPSYDLDVSVRAALEEDAGQLGDVTTLATAPEGTQASAIFVAKADGVLAGLAVVDQTFAVVDPTVRVAWTAKDGDAVKKGKVFGTLEGSALSILTGERVALNFLQRMSGIATATAAMITAVKGTQCQVLETRKTVPGLRILDKWAVLIGGGRNHRLGLWDMVMIKDNHIAAAGGIPAAVQRTQEYLAKRGLRLPVEVECSTLPEVEQTLQLLRQPGCCITRIMLDNMAKYDAALPGGVDITLLQQAMDLIRGSGLAVETEASGNVTLDTVSTIAQSGVAFVSCGALTHSVIALDISLRIKTRAQ